MGKIRNTIKGALGIVEKVHRFETAHAHCDIPCGIYDPHAAQVAAHTALRMDMLIDELNKSGNMDVEARNKMIRCVRVKEKHAEACEDELETLWADYFKPDHFKKFPDLHQTIWDTIQLASKTKQGTKIADAQALLAGVEKVAEIFWETKGVKTKRVKSFYPTEAEIVYPVV